MKRVLLSAVLGLAVLTCVPLFAAEPPRAATDSPKIAVANTAKIFSDTQELKDLKQKMEGEQKMLQNVAKERNDKIVALKSSRDALKPETPQYQEKNAELLKAAIEFETWGKINQANFQHEQKIQMKLLFEKIQVAVEKIAKQKGFDLVLTDQRPELPDDIDQTTVEQLRGMINSRTVIYANQKVDISADALAMLDSEYRDTTKPKN